MNEQTIHMTLYKSTKGTHVYEAIDDDAGIRTIYIKKSALPPIPPTDIVVKVAALEVSTA